MNERIDLMAPEVRANPYPLYAELRRSRPVVQVEPAGLWAVTRYEDVAFVLRRPEMFSSHGFRAAWEPAWLGENPVARSVLATDGAPHDRLRALVTRAFGAKAMARLEPKVRAVAADLAGRLAAAGEADFIASFALPLPAFVIADLLGLDRSLWRRFKRWTDDIVSVTPVPPSPEHAARVRATIDEIKGYFTEVIAARRRAPVDDFMTDLMRAEVDGQSLTDEELVSFGAVLLLGGFDSTTYLLANAVRVLAERPELAAALRADPTRTSSFIEEVLRHDAPVQGVPRIATDDVALCGVILPRGALVLPLIGSANRDERVFEDPDRFDMDRGHPGIPFGAGIHACIGAALARMEGRLAIEALLARCDGVVLPPGELVYNRSLTVRGPLAMPVRLVG